LLYGEYLKECEASHYTVCPPPYVVIPTDFAHFMTLFAPDMAELSSGGVRKDNG
jgi:hypothetical protein